MKLLAVTCNNCGGPLEIPRKIRFLTCTYCGSRLEIKHEGNVVFADVLERVERNTEKVVDNTETIKVQNEIERLDREWTMGLQRYQVQGANGHLNIPTTGQATGGLVFGLVMGVAFISIGVTFFEPIMVIVGLIVGAAATMSSTRAMDKAKAYNRAKVRYHLERQELLRRIGGETGGVRGGGPGGGQALNN